MLIETFEKVPSLSILNPLQRCSTAVLGRSYIIGLVGALHFSAVLHLPSPHPDKQLDIYIYYILHIYYISTAMRRTCIRREGNPLFCLQRK